MSVMRIRFRKLGGHYHCRVFTAKVPNMAYCKNGDLVFDEHEWEDVKRMLAGVEFREEVENPASRGKNDEAGRD